MKKYIKLTVLLISSLLLFCSCSDNTISSDTPSNMTNSSVSEDTEKSYAIHHEKVVTEGMALTELCEKGILPNLSSFGIGYDSFHYQEAMCSYFTTTNNYGGATGSAPTDTIYRYLHETDDSYDYSQRCWNEYIEIDEEGRIVNIQNLLTDKRREKYIEHIPEENTLSKDELLESADRLWKIIAKNGKINPDEYTQKVSYWDDGSIRINYTKDIIKDVIRDICSITLFPNGEIDHVYTKYSDIAPNFTSAKFDDNIDTMMDEYITRRHGNAKEEQYEYSFGSGTFQAVNGKIYGAYTYTIAFYDDEYPDEPAYGCYSVYFEEP